MIPLIRDTQNRRFIEREQRLEVTRDLGEGVWGINCLMSQDFPFGVMQMFGYRGESCTTLSI